jgi:hypothetical protein
MAELLDHDPFRLHAGLKGVVAVRHRENDFGAFDNDKQVYEFAQLSAQAPLRDARRSAGPSSQNQ